MLDLVPTVLHYIVSLPPSVYTLRRLRLRLSRVSSPGTMAGKQGAQGIMVRERCVRRFVCIDPTTPCEPYSINLITLSA